MSLDIVIFKKIAKSCTLPVVILTSRENPLHRNRAMALGASGYLTKPFQPNQLIASIQEFLAEPAPVA
ncbi:MAG: response regulator [Synechocystis sp.]